MFACIMYLSWQVHIGLFNIIHNGKGVPWEYADRRPIYRRHGWEDMNSKVIIFLFQMVVKTVLVYVKLNQIGPNFSGPVFTKILILRIRVFLRMFLRIVIFLRKILRIRILLFTKILFMSIILTL